MKKLPLKKLELERETVKQLRLQTRVRAGDTSSHSAKCGPEEPVPPEPPTSLTNGRNG